MRAPSNEPEVILVAGRLGMSAKGHSASLLGGVGDALGAGARVVGTGARFGAGRAVSGIVVVGALGRNRQGARNC